MPNMLSLRRTIQRQRVKELPPNPSDLEDLAEIPADYRVTMSGDDFLLYDSFEDITWNSDGRIMMFSTEKNLKKLSEADTWYLDGTFKVAPAIFFQLFVIMASVVQMVNGTVKKFAVPLVYTLMTSKEEVSL